MRNPAAPAVMLLHGQPGSGADWRLVTHALPRNITVLGPERPGYGRNPGAATGFAGNADAAVRNLDEAGIQSAVVAGYSWAGGVAIDLAARYPERVAGLLLVGSVGPGAVGAVDRMLTWPVLGRFASYVLAIGGGIALHPLLRFATRLAIGPRERRAGQLMFRHNKRRRLAHTYLVEQQALIHELPRVLEQLQSIAANTIVMTASDDLIIRPHVAQTLAERIPNASLRVLERGGHLLPHRMPAEVARAIEDLMSGSTSQKQYPERDSRYQTD